MRKTLIALAGVLALGLGAANAQTIDNSPSNAYYAGASLGLVTGSGLNTTGSLTGHFGIADLLAENFDARFDLGIFFTGGISLGANALYYFDLQSDAPINVYVGGGPRLYIDDGAYFGLGIRGGADYGFSDVLDGFAELRVDPVFGDRNSYRYRLRRWRRLQFLKIFNSTSRGSSSTSSPFSMACYRVASNKRTRLIP